MQLRETTKRKFHSILITTLVMMGFAVLYAELFLSTRPRIIENGLIIGFIIGFVSSCAEVLYFQARGRRLRFWILLLLRTAFYVVLITVTVVYVYAYHLTVMHSSTLSEAFRSTEFRAFLHEGEFTGILVYALAATLAVNFVRQVNRLLGQNALLYFFTGKYHTPIEELRVFMFLDLKASTGIAEVLGHARYHQFLNDFFHDITPAIVESNGEIYQYVGDEIVVSWPAQVGLKNANCILCYFRARAAIDLVSDRYERRYGFVPLFKVGYHLGPVIAGEIGDVRHEIVFHGDTVNTAARIRSECSLIGKDLLLSAELLTRLDITAILTPESVGQIKLSGKTESIELYTLKEAN